jgi:uncharacterized membrane protein
MTPSDNDENTLPLAAPCRSLHWQAPLHWLRLGWRDLRQAPAISLGYGLIMVVLSYAISAAAWYLGNLGLYLGLISGFVFLGPLLALTLYSVSARRENGARLTLGATARDAGRTLSDAMVFAMALLVVFLVWARAATLIHVFFPVAGDTNIGDWVIFLGIGSAVGAVFCAVIFMASAFSLPMILDRETDTITAIISSVNATLRNKAAMFVWAIAIGACVLAGVMTGYLGFAVLLPLIGHATWHGYRETLDTTDWPRKTFE